MMYEILSYKNGETEILETVELKSSQIILRTKDVEEQWDKLSNEEEMEKILEILENCDNTKEVRFLASPNATSKELADAVFYEAEWV